MGDRVTNEAENSVSPIMTLNLGGASLRVMKPFRGASSGDHFTSYDDVLDLAGETLREQTRTLLRRISLPKDDGTERHCVLKIYRYPNVTGARTIGLRSKAQREFDALAFCAAMNAPAIVPVACGTRRNPAGFVVSCFVITEYVEGYVTLWDWLSENHPLSSEHADFLSRLLRECGSVLRNVHKARLFLFTFAAKNILLRPDDLSTVDWRFLDLPYALTLQPRPLARWAQQRDLGALAGPILRLAGEEASEAFYESYLPDPLGGSDESLRRLIRRGALIYNKQTPLTRGVKRLKGALRRMRG